MINSFKGKYFFLSNYYPSPVSEKFKDGTIITYPTVEHAFQATKTKDISLRKQIANCATPKDAKHMGRHISLRKDWNDIKIQVMITYLRIKFSNPELKQKLINTGNDYLEEGNNWHDNLYGNCYCEKCKDINGQNHLGRMLMQVREEAKNNELNYEYNENNF